MSCWGSFTSLRIQTQAGGGDSRDGRGGETAPALKYSGCVSAGLAVRGRSRPVLPRTLAWLVTRCGAAARSSICSCEKQHLQLRGTHPTRRIPWTMVAQPYPRGFSRMLALALNISAKWCKQEKLNIQRCCRAGSLRIGEATNPGPERTQRQPRGSLEEVHLIRPETMRMEAKLLQEFLAWCERSITTTFLIWCLRFWVRV